MNEDQNCIMLYSLKYLGGVSIIKHFDRRISHPTLGYNEWSLKVHAILLTGWAP